MAKGRNKRRRKGRKTPGDALKKIRIASTGGKDRDVWAFQDAIRKRGYFARAVGPTKVATTAPKDVA